jgi:DNA-binding HxlR family transcriptional regulator
MDEIAFVSHIARVGGAAQFAILQALHSGGPSTSRRLTAVTSPFGTSRQTAVDKILKRLERSGYVSLVDDAGVRHYRLTEVGASLVEAVARATARPFAELSGWRMLLVDLKESRHRTVVEALRKPAVAALFHADGVECDYAAVCADEPGDVAAIEDRLHDLGAGGRSLRLASRL